MARSRLETRVTLLVAGLIGLCIGLIAWRASKQVRPERGEQPPTTDARPLEGANQPPVVPAPEYVVFPRTAIYAVDFVPNQPHLAVAGSSQNRALQDQPTVRVWDFDARREVATLRRDGEVGRYAFATTRPDGKLLAAAGVIVEAGKSLGNICVWNLETMQVVWSAQFSVAVTCVAWSPDGTQLAVGDSTGAVTVRAGGTGRVRGSWNLVPDATGPTVTLAWNRDGQLLAASTPSSARVWDVANRKELAVTNAPKNHFLALAFGPDKETVLVGGRWEATDVWVWDYSANRETRQFAKQAAPVSGLVLQGSTLVTTSIDATDDGPALGVRGWYVAGGQHLWTATSDTDAPNINARQCAVSPDGKRVAIAVMDRTDDGAEWGVDLHEVPRGK